MANEEIGVPEEQVVARWQKRGEEHFHLIFPPTTCEKDATFNGTQEELKAKCEAQGQIYKETKRLENERVSYDLLIFVRKD